MTQHAHTYLEQARAFRAAGDARRALDLLRRAKVFAAQDPALLAQVIDEMLVVADAAGCGAEADLWREQQAALRRAAASRRAGARTPAPSDEQRAALLPAGRTPLWHRLGGRRAALAIGVLVVAAAGAYFAPRWWRATPVPWEQRLNENVGLVVWFERYESLAGGQRRQIEVPISTGTAFAIGRDGVMVTNRHVTEPPTPASRPMPDGFELRGRPVLRVCFGPSPDDHFTARVVHQSADYDLAVLEVPRTFAHPLRLAREPVGRSTPVMAVGFPGVVQRLGFAANPAHQDERLQEAERTGRLSYADWFTPDSFEPVVTSGVISGVNRVVDERLYYLFDAKVGQGNSGGPLLRRESDEVIGIVSLKAGGGVSSPEEEGYNYALALPQLLPELHRYTP
jgi:S1-C subfamily serine protease